MQNLAYNETLGKILRLIGVMQNLAYNETLGKILRLIGVMQNLAYNAFVGPYHAHISFVIRWYTCVRRLAGRSPCEGPWSKSCSFEVIMQLYISFVVLSTFYNYYTLHLITL
jgi:hypothetical protein